MRGYRVTHHLASQRLVDDKKPPLESANRAESTQSQEPSFEPSQSSPLPSRDSTTQSLTSRRFTNPKLPALPQRVANLLRLPRLRRKSSPSRPTQAPSPPPSSSSPFPKATFESLSRPQTRRYQSFPPPIFTGAGQPRALDSRLSPENLVDKYSYLSEEEERSWRARSHSWDDVLAARTTNRNTRKTNASADDNAEKRKRSPLASPAQHPNTTSPNPLPDSANPPPLHLRGGAGRRKPKDTEALPPLTWWLAGGRGAPPTAGNYRKWREREKARIAEENKKRGRKEEGRGFWREMWWVLGGAKRAEYERRRKKGGCGDGGAGGGGGDGAAGGAAGGGGGNSAGTA